MEISYVALCVIIDIYLISNYIYKCNNLIFKNTSTLNIAKELSKENEMLVDVYPIFIKKRLFKYLKRTLLK